MVIAKETLTDFKEKFEKAYTLVDEDSRNDPPTDPYRSHYAAREILIEMMENLKNSVHSEDDLENKFIYKVILAFVYRDLGRINVFTEEVTTGEKYIKNCLDLIEVDKMRPEAAIPYVGALNELGIIWTNRQNPEEAQKYLSQAEEHYKEFKKTGKDAMAITDVFGTADEVEKDKGPRELEKLHTLTLFYLAQVLGYLGELDVSAMYCNTTLRRQLEAKDYDSIDWALNSATLSQYFLTPNKFSIARHHLAAATLIMAEYETKMITPEMSEDAQAAAQETFKHRFADIGRCWAKYGYGLALLLASKEHLMAENDEAGTSAGEKDEDKINKEVANIQLQESSTSYRFTTLDLSIYEDRISDSFCLTFDDAKEVHHFVVMWLDRAKEYYTSDTEASEYAKIIMDYAELHKLLAFFDDNPANQSKLQKKRADYIEGLLDILNPTYYLSICRECWYGCGLAYSAILDIKLDALAKLKFEESPTPHQVHKINLLCDKAIKNFKEFIDSYKDQNDKLQKNMPKDELQVVLDAYFHIGRLFYKIITPNKQMQLSNLQNSLKYYKLFVSGCEENEEAKSSFAAEIGVCKEMITLLPLKIQKTLNEIRYS